MDKEFIEQVQGKLGEIYQACNDERSWEIQLRLSNFIQWFDNSLNIKSLTIEEIKKLSKIGKEILLMDYQYRQHMKNEK